MTYNFDPDRWYDNHLAALEARRATLSEEEYQAALAELERRYDALLERLDGTYRMPPSTDPD